ncbi:hypothetical protein BX616_001158, partial [Lobosporangium transversale]
MLGPNATRPLSMTRIMSHRLSQWMLRPYALLHVHRFLFLTPQLLLTNTPNGATKSKNGNISTPTLIQLDGSASTSQLHTSATAAPSVTVQPQLVGQEILLPPDLYSTGQYPVNGTAASVASAAVEEEDKTIVDTASPSTTTAAPASTATSTNGMIAFNYLLAASWHPKSRQRQQILHQQQLENAANEERTLRWRAKLRAAHPRPHPHPGKVDAGEDAFFHVSTPSRVALGVADGVGGWSEMGVDPALFSWALMNNAENIARLTDNIPPTAVSESGASADPTLAAGGERRILDAQTILDGAYSELVQSGTVEAGSSTACILSLCKLTGTLKASNLGDSAFLLIRDNRCIYESPSQQHFWNCPYQLTVLPPKLRQQQHNRQGPGDNTEHTDSDNDVHHSSNVPKAKAAAKKKAYVQDLPKDAVQTTHQLQDGDVIVLATDGFWDNVFTKEAIELVDRELGDIIREQQRQHQRQFERGVHQEQHEVVESKTVDEILARVRALSKRLTNTARRFSLDSKRMTPFSQGA